jgi:hypothetical protein
MSMWGTKKKVSAKLNNLIECREDMLQRQFKHYCFEQSAMPDLQIKFAPTTKAMKMRFILTSI